MSFSGEYPPRPLWLQVIHTLAWVVVVPVALGLVFGSAAVGWALGLKPRGGGPE